MDDEDGTDIAGVELLDVLVFQIFGGTSRYQLLYIVNHHRSPAAYYEVVIIL